VYQLSRNAVVTSVLQASSSSSSAESSDDEVLVSQLGDKGVLTMNRPKVLNALNISMIEHMTAQIKVNFMYKICGMFSMCIGFLVAHRVPPTWLMETILESL